MIKSIVRIGSRCKMEKLSIGKMANICNVSIQTLRYYDKIDLIKPAIRDTKNGYRYYDINQVFRINIIKYLQHTGSSLKEIKQVLTLDSERLVEFWNQQELEIENKIQNLQRTKELIRGQQLQFQQLNEIQKFSQEIVYQRAIPQELIIQIKPITKITPLSHPDAEVSRLENILLQNKTMANLQYGFSYPLKEYNDLTEIEYDSIFTRVFSSRIDEAEELLTYMLSGQYLCISFFWDRTKYLSYYQKLFSAFLHKFGTIPTEVYEVSIVDEYHYENEQNFLTELRVKIPKNYH